MDPNATLAELRTIANEIDADDTDDAPEYLARAQELFQALDEWLTKGSFLPDEWVHPRRCWFCGAGHAPERKD